MNYDGVKKFKQLPTLKALLNYVKIIMLYNINIYINIYAYISLVSKNSLVQVRNSKKCHEFVFFISGKSNFLAFTVRLMKFDYYEI